MIYNSTYLNTDRNKITKRCYQLIYRVRKRIVIEMQGTEVKINTPDLVIYICMPWHQLCITTSRNTVHSVKASNIFEINHFFKSPDQRDFSCPYSNNNGIKTAINHRISSLILLFSLKSNEYIYKVCEGKIKICRIMTANVAAIVI